MHLTPAGNASSAFNHSGAPGLQKAEGSLRPLLISPSRPVFFLLAGWILGTLAGRHLPGYFAVVAAGTLVLGGILIHKLIRGVAGHWLTPLSLTAALGYLALQPWMIPPGDPHHIRHYISPAKLEITGTVAVAPKIGDYRLQTVLQVSRIRPGQSWQPSRGMVRLVIRGDLPSLGRGDRLTLVGKLRAIRNFANPGGFDYERFMAWQGIHAGLYVNADDVRAVRRAQNNDPSVLSWWRERVDDAIEQLPAKWIGPDGRSLMQALLLGRRGAIAPGMTEAFRRTGTAHLLAISGLHMGMVAGAAFGVLKLLFNCCPYLLLRGWSRKAAALGAMAVVILYGILTGLAPSTQRALIMVGLALAGLVIEKEADPYNLLAWAALVIFAWYPPALFTLSFQLSFGAVFWIVFGLAQLKQWPGRRSAGQEEPAHGGRPLQWMMGLGRWLVLSLLVTLLATLGTLPIIISTFNQISLVGLGCNLLLVPLVGWLILPLGLLAVLTAIFSPTLAGSLLIAAAIPLKWLCHIVGNIGAWPWAAVKVVSLSSLEMGGLYLLLGSGLVLVGSLFSGDLGGQVTLTAPEPPKRRWAAILCLVALVVLTADSAYWVHRRFFSRQLRLTVLDVGQGTAVVAELPGGDVLLVDGGGFADSATFDVGARLVAPFLWDRKIATVRILALTHPNSDHLNGLTYIADHFHVSEFWWNGQKAESAGFKRLQETVDRRGIARVAISAAHTFRPWDRVQTDVLYPPAGFLDRTGRSPWSDSNNNSLVLKLTYGRHSILLTGDIMAAAEKELAAMAGDELQSTVLVVPHHGSRSSSTTVFLDKVQPRYAIIPCGWQNRYRFPHPTVLTRLESYARRIFRTDEEGAVIVYTDGRVLSIQGTSQP